MFSSRRLGGLAPDPQDVPDRWVDARAHAQRQWSGSKDSEDGRPAMVTVRGRCGHGTTIDRTGPWARRGNPLKGVGYRSGTESTAHAMREGARPRRVGTVAAPVWAGSCRPARCRAAGSSARCRRPGPRPLPPLREAVIRRPPSHAEPARRRRPRGCLGRNRRGVPWFEGTDGFTGPCEMLVDSGQKWTAGSSSIQLSIGADGMAAQSSPIKTAQYEPSGPTPR